VVRKHRPTGDILFQVGSSRTEEVAKPLARGDLPFGLCFRVGFDLSFALSWWSGGLFGLPSLTSRVVRCSGDGIVGRQGFREKDRRNHPILDPAEEALDLVFEPVFEASSGGSQRISVVDVFCQVGTEVLEHVVQLSAYFDS
jgi:hypothetical protein